MYRELANRYARGYVTEDDWFKRGTKGDDPELVAFEAAIRRRNVLVYLIGGLVSLPVGAFFAILGWSLGAAQRVVTMGVMIFMMGVGCIVQSWRLAHGAPMTPDGVAVDPVRARRRAMKAFIGMAIVSFVAGAAMLALAHVRDASRLRAIGIGMLFGGLVCVYRAFTASTRPPEDDTEAT
jgi:hypothetical protein